MMTSFDNNEDKVCSFLKDDVGGSRIKSHAKSHDLRSRDHDVTVLDRGLKVQNRPGARS